MRLSKIEFSNFRCFRDDVIKFDNYTSLVGPNNCGKSTALRALNIFFDSASKTGAITNEDFYIGAPTEAQLSIKFEFTEVNGEAAKALAHYVRNGKVQFEIIANREENNQITSMCRGIRFGLEKFAPFFAAEKAGDKKPIYEELLEEYDLAPWKTMAQATEEIQRVELEKSDEHTAIPSNENAYGATGPIPILKNYIDWIYIPAVKEAASETSEHRNSAFSKLILLAVRSKCDFSEKIHEIKKHVSTDLTEVLDQAEGILKEVGGEIDRDFKNLTTTPIDVSINWGAIDEIALKEPHIESSFKDGRVIASPNEFGHGLQRTYIMALLSLVAKTQNTNNDFCLLLGVEEPELYQHPPQAKYLANALFELSKGNSQVIVTTHSPTFISGDTFESIRVLKKKENKTTIHTWSLDEQRAYCAARLDKAPIGEKAALSGIDRTLQTNISELFFASKIILVEGIEDQAIIEAFLKKKDKIAHFLQAGCHIISVGGKPKMPMIIALARGFGIDVFCLFDMDMDKPEKDQANAVLVKYAASIYVCDL
jgi:predicted ATP-binding protein involved in virulence